MTLPRPAAPPPRRAHGDEGGVAALETVALLPWLVVLAVACLQLAAAVWTATSTDLAVRQAARADSLGRDPRLAAERALPAGLSVKRLERFGPDNGVRLVVGVPRVSPLPRFDVTRTLELP